MSPEITLSIIATTLAVASFCGALWRTWRDKPRLNFYVRKTVIDNKPDNQKFEMLQIKACNIGFRPIILTGCAALGESSSFSMGLHDEPAATYGVEDQRFPSVLEPGETLTFHPMTIDALEKRTVPPEDPNASSDPYKYLVLIDSFGRFHHMKMEDIRWHLNMDKRRIPASGREKIFEFLKRKRLFNRKKRELQIA